MLYSGIRTSLYHGFMCTPSSGLCHQKSCRAVRQLQPVHRQRQLGIRGSRRRQRFLHCETRYPRLLLHSTFWHLHADDKYVTEPEPGRLHFLCREHVPCSLRNGPLDGGVVGGAVPREDSISGRLTSDWAITASRRALRQLSPDVGGLASCQPTCTDARDKRNLRGRSWWN